MAVFLFYGAPLGSRVVLSVQLQEVHPGGFYCASVVSCAGVHPGGFYCDSGVSCAAEDLLLIQTSGNYCMCLMYTEFKLFS